MRPEDRRHVIKMMAQEIQEEFEAALAEEREALCQALCPFCAEGLPLIGHDPDDGWWGHPGKGTCNAVLLHAAIRARA